MDMEKSGILRLTQEEVDSFRRGEEPASPVLKDWNLSLHEFEEMIQSNIIIITER